MIHAIAAHSLTSNLGQVRPHHQYRTSADGRDQCCAKECLPTRRLPDVWWRFQRDIVIAFCNSCYNSFELGEILYSLHSLDPPDISCCLLVHYLTCSLRVLYLNSNNTPKRPHATNAELVFGEEQKSLITQEVSKQSSESGMNEFLISYYNNT